MKKWKVKDDHHKYIVFFCIPLLSVGMKTVGISVFLRTWNSFVLGQITDNCISS